MRSVANNHNVAQHLAVGLQLHVQYVAFDGNCLRGIADIRELQFFRSVGYGERIISVEVRNGSYGCSCYKYVYADKRLVGVIGYFACNRSASRLGEGG